jgi:hypothetical protein
MTSNPISDSLATTAQQGFISPWQKATITLHHENELQSLRQPDQQLETDQLPFFIQNLYTQLRGKCLLDTRNKKGKMIYICCWNMCINLKRQRIA